MTSLVFFLAQIEEKTKSWVESVASLVNESPNQIRFPMKGLIIGKRNPCWPEHWYLYKYKYKCETVLEILFGGWGILAIGG